MKVKAAITEGVPEEFVEKMNSPETAQSIFSLLAKHLRVAPEELGPATHYMQEADRTIQLRPRQWGCEVRVSGVSVTHRRAPIDFWEAVDGLHKLIREIIVQEMPKGTRVQLFVALMLDSPVPTASRGNMTTLIESTPEWVNGNRSS